jgi:hypothetical protein
MAYNPVIRRSRMKNDDTFGSEFERILVGLLAVVTGFLLIYLAVQGPLFLSHIRYMTHPVINNQIIGQDVVNLFLLSAISLAGGIALWLRKAVAKYLLLMTPLYLIYFVLSYTIGWEWSSPLYSGNSETYFFHFLFILVAALVSMLYSLSVFPRDRVGRFARKGLAAYSILLVLFLLVFAAMWMKEVLEVMAKGTTRSYDIAPTAFWLVRVFDLGFFTTMAVAVNAMGVIMWLKKDPTFLARDLAVFLALGVIVFAGFFYILRGYRKTAP